MRIDVISSLATQQGCRERIQRELAAGWNVTVVEEDGTISAFLAIKPAAQALDQLFVADASQKRGLGSALLALAKSAMPSGFHLRCAAANKAACAFYRKNGFSVARTEPHPVLGHPTVIFHWSEAGAARGPEWLAACRPPVPPVTCGNSSQVRGIPINPADPRARDVLCDVREHDIAGDNFYAREAGDNPPYGRRIDGAIPGLLVRQSLIAPLQHAATNLLALGLQLYVLDAYRPIAVQRALWRFVWDDLARRHSQDGPEALADRASVFVSDPRGFTPENPASWPLHITGGAVDVVLRDPDGRMLDFGTPFDDASECAATAYLEAACDAGRIACDDPRLLARRVLYHAMIDAGFTNYANEWWHYDLGNQMHVATRAALGQPVGSGHAWYGYTVP